MQFALTWQKPLICNKTKRCHRLSSLMCILYLAQQVAGEDEGGEAFVGGGHYFVLGAYPFQFSFIYIYNVFADAHYGVHVVGVDDGGHVVLFGNAVDEFVYDQ